MKLLERLTRMRFFQSFRNEYLLALLPTSLLPLLVTLVLVLNITNDHFRSQRIESMLGEMHQAQSNLENRLEQIRLVSENLTNYITAQLSRNVREKQQSYTELFNYESMRNNVSNMEAIYNISRIRIFSDRIPYLFGSDYLSFFEMSGLDALSAEHPEVLQKVTTDSLRAVQLEGQVLPAKSYGKGYTLLSFYRSVYDVNQNLVAVYLMEFDTDLFLSEAKADLPGASIYVTDSQDSLVLANAEARATPLAEAAQALPVGGQEYHMLGDALVIRNPLTTTDWTLTIAMPLDSGWSMRGTLSEIYIVIILFTFLGSLVVGMVLSHLLTRRLTRFYDAVRAVDFTLEDQMPTLPDKLNELLRENRYPDEIDKIMSSFTTLISDNLRLITHMKQHDLDIAKYKFQVLQEQINPHFLYNALETIRLCMTMDRREDALHTLDALSKFYRIALSKGRDTINIQEELDMIGCYLEIENIGYEGRLHWELSVDPLCLDLPIPKFLLQPLIENSIVHGHMSRDKKKLSILIDIHLDGDVVLMQVRDDGVGIKPEVLERLRNALQDPELRRGSVGYGLNNVNHRLKLFYGSDYGLVITSNEAGTLNEIRLPIHLL